MASFYEKLSMKLQNEGSAVSLDTVPLRSLKYTFPNGSVARPPGTLVNAPIGRVEIVPSNETFRSLDKPLKSNMKMSPRGSTATRTGENKAAEVAGPPSPPLPPPATVLIMPCETLRIRAFPVSAMYRFPAESTAIPYGDCNVADVAGPLSPKPLLPPPAKVVIVPPLTLRIR